MRCVDCKFRDMPGSTLDVCPKFGKRILNGAIIGHIGGIEIIECEQGELIETSK